MEYKQGGDRESNYQSFLSFFVLHCKYQYEYVQFYYHISFGSQIFFLPKHFGSLSFLFKSTLWVYVCKSTWHSRLLKRRWLKDNVYQSNEDGGASQFSDSLTKKSTPYSCASVSISHKTSHSLYFFAHHSTDVNAKRLFSIIYMF